MTCQEYRDRVTIRLADGSELPGDHGEACGECGRYAERARATWEALGRLPDEPVPAAVSERLLRSCGRSRRSGLRLLIAGAAAILAVGGLTLVLRTPPGSGQPPLMESDGMTVERYDLPAGASPADVAEELRRKVAPDAWTEGVGGLEAGEGFLRVRGPADLQQAVREYLRRSGR